MMLCNNKQNSLLIIQLRFVKYEIAVPMVIGEILSLLQPSFVEIIKTSFKGLSEFTLSKAKTFPTLQL